MPIKAINWEYEWALISNSFGQFLSYNRPYLNKQYFKQTYQIDILRMLLRGEYEIFVDLGAYIGYFSIIASKYCKKVIAYEAAPLFYGLLLHNTKFKDNVECKYAFVGNEDSIPKINKTIFRMADVRCVEEYNIPVVTLDNELLKYKDKKMLIKMDIEGGEKNALLGAKELLKYDNIHWHVDIHPYATTEKEIFGFFKNRKRNGHAFLCHKE